MKILAIGISFENVCTWSLEMDYLEKDSIIRELIDCAHCSSSDLDEVLIIQGSKVLYQWSSLNGDF